MPYVLLSTWDAMLLVCIHLMSALGPDYGRECAIVTG